MSRRRGSALPIVLVILVVIAAGTVLAIRVFGDEPRARRAAANQSAPSHPPSTTAPPTTSTTPADQAEPPLWPFRTLEEARRWQVEQAPAGHSPWHADAEATALAFTTGYLGFTDVDTVVRSEIEATEALVKVGYQGESGRPAPAATLALVRFGDGPQAPWEVVGTVDDTMSITEPAPGVEVTSPVRVGGLISGVDESIRVQMRDPAAQRPVGEACCLPAGGENSPWSTPVTYRGASGAVLTIVASTGGHIADVERFAVIGVRPAT
ncbi:hypothetical protein [Actinophytocola sp.]|uniref:hypothetical protein n=1 Tax=Actinophytocola sp. TaxID=1872138 RepID=UPI003D6A6A03